MHVSPADFRSVRGRGITLRFAILGDIAYILADLPNGSAGTALEEACKRQHWAFALEGSVEVEVRRRRHEVPPGTAFHLAAGTAHRIFAVGPARLAGFERIDPGRDVSDERLRAEGFEILNVGPNQSPGLTVPPVRARTGRSLAEGRVAATTHRMGDLVFTQASFGPRSGYTSAWCDLPHWGLVAEGAVAIEWENDVEVLTAGDVFYCPPGPPGHRIEAADGATIVDFTPIDRLDGGGRIAGWRRGGWAMPSSGGADHPSVLELASLR
jgi:quercetin dioxygenase-like cupin family protein